MYKRTDTGMKDRRITVETWTIDKSIGGGATGSIASSYQLWAQVEAKDGRMIEGEGQKLWPYSFKVTVRYEKSRPITTAQTIFYDGKRFSIGSVDFDREGMRKEVILKCSNTSS